MTDIFRSYISKLLVIANTENGDVVKISTNYLSPEGDVFTLDTRTIRPSVIQTTQSLNELQPEISTVYPYKNVTPIEPDGSTLLLSPSIQTIVTSSQNYYAPVYFERYKPEILKSLDREFKELIAPTDISSSSASPGE